MCANTVLVEVRRQLLGVSSLLHTQVPGSDNSIFTCYVILPAQGPHYLICFLLSHTIALNLSIPQGQKKFLKYFQKQKDKCWNSEGGEIISVLSSLMLLAITVSFCPSSPWNLCFLLIAMSVCLCSNIYKIFSDYSD